MNFINGNVIEQRQAAQCVGRVIRSKADYGMMIFADKRFVFSLFYLNFPFWMRKQFHCIEIVRIKKNEKLFRPVHILCAKKNKCIL